VTISEKAWGNYIARLRKINDTAVKAMVKRLEYVELAAIPMAERTAIIEYAYALTQKYGEAAASLSCEMYDALAELTGGTLLPAEPASTATYAEVAKAVNGTIKTGNKDIVSQAVGRMVKMTGVDTTMQNALRDGAEWAWIPQGETCAFCITLASRGWQRASKAALKGGHAEHIHANCDCTYAIRFDNSNVSGYNADKYKKMYYGAEGRTPREKINSMAREFYAENKEEINARKRDNYEKRKALESDTAEETDVS